MPDFSRLLPIYRQVWRMSLPVILTNLLVTLVNIVDVFMVGRLGPLEIAAVGMSNTIQMLIMVITFSITAGSMTLAAQAKGARDFQRLSDVTRQSLSLTVILAVMLTIFGLLISAPLLHFLSSAGDTVAVEMGLSYLRILFWGTLFLVGNLMISSLMQGAGDTVTPLYLSGGMNLLNILFNYLLIFGPGPFPALGVAGAALGTVLSRMLGVIAGILMFYSGKNVIKLLPGNYWPHWPMFRDILSIGIPSGLQGLVRNTTQILVVRIITSTAAGTFGAAALSIGLQIESLAFMPGLAISTAATSLVGQALGAWQVRDARAKGDAAWVLGVIVMSVIGVPLFIWAPQMVGFFDPSLHPTVLEAGTSYLRIMAITLPVLAVLMVINGALRGAGDSTHGLIANILGRWFTVLPIAYVLAITLEWGVVGVWWAISIGTLVSAVYVYWRWQGTGWPSVALYKSAVYRQHLKDLSKESREDFLQTIRTPLMALPETTEHVSQESVRYRLPDGDVVINFSPDGYVIAEGKIYFEQTRQSTQG
jgi:putative MATE family efflux protein